MPDDPTITEPLLADDLLYGAPQIAKFLGRTERDVRWAIDQGNLPCGKWGGRYVASKARLREYFANVTSGSAT